MTEFKLSASLEGHDDDVRGVVFGKSDTIFSASRDATVRIWKQLSQSPPKYDCSIASHGNSFVNSITYAPPSKEYPDGLIIAGGKDTVIEVRQPSKTPDENAERLLMGHGHNVCSLDISPEGGWIVSGSWDASARVWNTRNWDCQAVLEGHQASVWSVLAFDPETIITASADKLIRVYTPTGKLLQTVRGNTDVVRALAKLPKDHSSGADFASAGNDGPIRLWQLRGRQIAELHGHESFVYALATLPNGDLVSSGEDRTVRIWRGNECIQTITHPAISVWTVAASETGDIVTGASDRIARVFTRSAEKFADAEMVRKFEESVKGSSIPQQQVGDVNKEKLPGPEFLTQKSGTKEGQVAMIREANGSVTAHTWSMAAQQWVNVGTVVDAVGSSGKKTSHQGKDYDYVFDVDIEDGKPPLKLPYNLSQNPYEAAKRFIEDNELPIGYLDQVANFITTNTQGATIGQSQQPPGADPWGQESRYRPGDSAQPSAQQPRPKTLPQTQYLSIKTANLKAVEKKLEELNEQLLSDGSKAMALNPDQVRTLQSLTAELQKPSPSAISQGLEVVLYLAANWPGSHLLPVLDLLRLLTPTPAAAKISSIDALKESGALSDMDRPNNVMMATRAIANLFETSEGRALADENFDLIHEAVKPAAYVGSNRNLTIAVTTLYINFAVLCTAPSNRQLTSSTKRGIALLADLARILEEKDSEVVYRALVAAGTLLSLGEDVQAAAKVHELPKLIDEAGSRVKEPRIKKVVGEIEEMLA